MFFVFTTERYFFSFQTVALVVYKKRLTGRHSRYDRYVRFLSLMNHLFLHLGSLYSPIYLIEMLFM